MENYKNDAALYRKMKKKVEIIKGFYLNLACYLMVSPTLAYINLRYSPEFYWFLFSALGWGIGLTFHAMTAFDYHPFLGKAWEERKIKELLEKDNNSNN